MKYFHKWLADFRKRLKQYQEQEREPQLYVKSYFVDSGNSFMDLIQLYPNNKNSDVLWNWLYQIGSIFAKYAASDYFGRFNSISSPPDLMNCMNTLSQMRIVFFILKKYEIHEKISIFEKFFERISGFFSFISSRINENNYKISALYGCCIAIQTFSFFIEEFDEDDYYYKISTGYYKRGIKILRKYLENHNIFEEAPKSFALWLFIYKLLINEKSLDPSLINKVDLIENLENILPTISKITSLSYALDSARQLFNDIFNEYLKKTKEILENFIYSGTYWRSLARIAKLEFYIEIFNQEEKEDEFLHKFPNFEELNIPDSIFMKFLLKLLNIVDLIEADSTLKSLSRENKFKEENFRDFFKTHFEISGEWLVIDEFKGKKDRFSDLRVGIQNTLFRITTEFKIWKRNFDKYPPIEELLDNMGAHDQKGFIFMINPNQKSIKEKLKKELIFGNSKYFQGTYEDLVIKDRTFQLFKAKYMNENKLIEIYFYILDLSAYWM